MNLLTMVLVAAAVLLGAGVPLQAGANATLAQFQGHSVWAAFTNTAVASLLLILVAGLIRIPSPRLSEVTQAPAWSWAGGAIGASLVLGTILIAPRLGATAFVSAMIVGTLLTSTVVDHFGLVGFSEHPLSSVRALGCILLIGGLLLIQSS